MIAKDMLVQIQHAPLAERIQLIEVILKSLKDDIKSSIHHQPGIFFPAFLRPVLGVVTDSEHVGLPFE